MTVVTDEMVEAGAKAAYEHWSTYPACTASKSWEERAHELPGSAKFFRDVSRKALTAALSTEVVGEDIAPTPTDLAAACKAFSEARSIYPEGEAKTPITDWFDLDAQDAVDFGVLKEPKWDGYSDIRGMQHEWYVAAVIKEPMRAALAAVFESKRSSGKHLDVADYATRLFDLEGFMLLETYRGKHAVTVTFPDLQQAQQFHNTLVELSQHRVPDVSEGSTP